MLIKLLLHILSIFIQIGLSLALSSFFYNFYTKIYLRGRHWSMTMPDMLKEDKITSFIYLLAGLTLLSITIIINIFFRPLITFYVISFFMFIIGSSVIFPPKGRKISQNCYVMPYHKDHFIVTLNDHKIYIKGEYRRGNPDQIIYKEQLPKWLPPYENELVSEKDYDYMLNAILKFLEKLGKQAVIK